VPQCPIAGDTWFRKCAFLVLIPLLVIGWLVGRLTSPFSTKIGYIVDRLLVIAHRSEGVSDEDISRVR